MSTMYPNCVVEAAGPTVGFKLGTTESRFVSEKPHGSVSEKPNSSISHEKDSITRGVSALSLSMKYQSHSDASLLTNENPNPQIESLIPQNIRRLGRFYVNHHHLPGLDVVSEDKPWESNPPKDEFEETDALSSASSLNDVSDNSHGTYEDESQGASGDSEAQSTYKGPLDCLSSLEASLPIKKGLSQFYSGKSRSFTCLVDVLSVKDIAKPENPYNRRRKSFASFSNLDKLRSCALRTGSGICKKSLHSNKSTLALAVAMGKESSLFEVDGHECPVLGGTSSGFQSSSAPPRSFSLSDLQETGFQNSL